VTRFIFDGALRCNPLFRKKIEIREFLIQKIELMMCQPEEILIA